MFEDRNTQNEPKGHCTTMAHTKDTDRVAPLFRRLRVAPFGPDAVGNGVKRMLETPLMCIARSLARTGLLSPCSRPPAKQLLASHFGVLRAGHQGVRDEEGLRDERENERVRCVGSERAMVCAHGELTMYRGRHVPDDHV
eukprot:TRINITY_DN9146_c0_g1_i1.p2 TRINITY_DN9146_c0_g1~~TRINITY_DN9146_c0_g1_i1.p2  ORF type:complete len:140 (-),score=5.59 TRINITY_DN9146_c0_g1_i1:186-605(-)